MLCVAFGPGIAQLEALGLLGQLGGLHFHLCSRVGRAPVVTGLPALGCAEWRYPLAWFGLAIVFGIVQLKPLGRAQSK